VRALELDLHLRSDGGYDVYHISVIDPNTNVRHLRRVPRRRVDLVETRTRTTRPFSSGSS